MTQPPQTLRCNNCGHENHSDAKYCIVCDTPLGEQKRFQRQASRPSGLLPKSNDQLKLEQEAEERRRAEEEAEERRRAEEEEKKRKTQEVTQSHKTSHQCPDCGYNNRIGDFFCAECGATLSPAASKESPADLTQEMKALNVDDILSSTQRKRDPDATLYNRQSFQQDIDLSHVEKKPIPQEVAGVKMGSFQFEKHMTLRFTEVESERYTELVPTQNKPLLIGRSHKSLPIQPDIDLTPFLSDHHGVSRRHALIRLRDLRLEMQDLNSTNGTGINGFRFRPKEVHELRNGDVLTFGRVHVRLNFMVQDEADEASYDTDELD